MDCGAVLDEHLEARVKGKMADLFQTRSDLESKVNLLREMRYNNLSLIITER